MATAAEVIRYVYEVTGNAALRDIATELLKVEGVTEETQAAVKALADEFAKGTAARDSIANYVKTSAALTEVSGKLDAAKAKVAALTTAQAASGTTSAAATREIRAAEGAVTTLARQQSTLEVQLTRSNVALQRAGINATALSAADQRLADQLEQVRNQLREMSDEAGRAGKETSRLTNITALVTGAFGGAGAAVLSFVGKLGAVTGIAGAVGAALGAFNVGRFFSGAVESAKTLEAALSEVAAVSGAAGDQLTELKDAAEAASARTKFTAVEATSALGELARASGDASQAVGLLSPTLNLAQAAGIGASESATLLTTTLTQFGLAATEGARVADLFAREANSTNDTVTGLGLAMSYVAPLAKQLGISIESTTALIGALADQGFRGERAGTALRNVMSQLLDPTSKFSKELYGLGITSKDFNEVIFQLAAAGDRGRQALLALDSEARPAIASLVNSGGAGIRKLAEDLKNASGEAERTAQVMGENFAASTTRFTGALDFLRRALVEPLLEPLSKQFDGAADRIRAFVATADFQRLAASIKDFAVKSAESIVQFVASIDFTEATSRLTAFFTTLTNFVDSTSKGMSGLATTLSVIGNTISLFWNGLQTVILTGATVITGAVSLVGRGFIALQEGLARLAGSYDALRPFFEKSKEALLGLNAVAEEFGRRATANGKETAEAFKGLADALGKAGAAADAAASPFANVEAGVKTVEQSATGAAAGLDDLAASTRSVGDANRESVEAAKEFQRNLQLARGEVEVTRQALQLLITSGETSGVAFQQASNAFEAAKAKLAGLTKGATDGAAAADLLKAAYTDLGIKSQADLEATATKAAKSAEIVSAAYGQGRAKIEDLVRAVKVWAEAERAASADSTDAMKQATEAKIEARFAALGLTEEVQKAGEAGREAGAKITEGMVNAKAATDAAAESARLAALGYGDLLYEANKGNAAAQAMLQSIKDGTDTTSRAATGQQSFAAGIVAVGTAAGAATSEITTLTQASEAYATEQMRRAAEISQSGGYGSQYLLDVKARLTQQELALVEATQQLNDRYGSQAELADLARRAAISGTVVLDQQIAQLERQKDQYADLSDQIRGPYIAAIDQAIAKVRQQAAAVQSAASDGVTSANASADAREREATAARATAEALARAAALSPPASTQGEGVRRIVLEHQITINGTGAGGGTAAVVDVSSLDPKAIADLARLLGPTVMPYVLEELRRGMLATGSR